VQDKIMVHLSKGYDIIYLSRVIIKAVLEKSDNGEYWIGKISRNRERDDEINKQLLFRGWTVIRFWGKDIMKHTDECVKVVEETIFDITVGMEDL
jgi:DNA mismatch endonuclease (patch repair protein)